MRFRLLLAALPLLCVACAGNSRVVSLTGREEALADMRGQVLVVNVWETWCKPCVAEMPALLALAEELEPLGVRVLAVNRSTSVEEVRAVLDFVKGQPPGLLPRVYLARGSFRSDFAARGVPATFVVDRQGKVVATLVGVEMREGRVNLERLRKVVLEALAVPAPQASASGS